MNPRLFFLVLISIAGRFYGQGRIFGVATYTGFAKQIIYYDCSTSTTHTAVDLYSTPGGDFHTTNFEGSSDLFNKRYFIRGISSGLQGWRLYIYNAASMSLTTTPVFGGNFTVNEMEYDPFYNRVLYQSSGQLMSYDLASNVASMVCTLPPNPNGGVLGSTRAFDPVSQHYYYVRGDNTYKYKTLFDVSGCNALSSVQTALSNAVIPGMVVYDYTTMKYYGISNQYVISFDAVTGATTQIVPLPPSAGVLNSQQGVFNHQTHTYMLPLYINSQNRLLTVDVVTHSITANVPFPESDLNKLFYDGVRPLIRRNNEGELMCTYGASYQWYFNGQPVPSGTTQTLPIKDGGHYYAEVQSLNGDTATTDSLQVLATSLANMGRQQVFSISPNPVYDKVTVQFDRTVQDAEIRLCDLFGKNSRSFKVDPDNTFSIDCGDLPPGVYVLSVSEKGRQLHTEKLIVVDR